MRCTTSSAGATGDIGGPLSSAVIARRIAAAEGLQARLRDARAGRRAALAGGGDEDGGDPVVVQRSLLGQRAGRGEPHPLDERARAAGVAAQLGAQRLLHGSLQSQRGHPEVVGPAGDERAPRRPRREVAEHDRRLDGLAAQHARDVARARRPRRARRGHDGERALRAARRAEHAGELEQPLGRRQRRGGAGRGGVARRDDEEPAVQRPGALGDDGPQIAPAVGRDLRARLAAHVEPEPAQAVGDVRRERLVVRAAGPAIGVAGSEAAASLEVLPGPVAIERDWCESRPDRPRTVLEGERDQDEREQRRDQRSTIDPRVEHAR